MFFLIALTRDVETLVLRDVYDFMKSSEWTRKTTHKQRENFNNEVIQKNTFNPSCVCSTHTSFLIQE